MAKGTKVNLPREVKAFVALMKNPAQASAYRKAMIEAEATAQWSGRRGKNEKVDPVDTAD